jgi:SAM-dependent methyltransferase
MRHSRSERFERARVQPLPAAKRWSEVDPDPNAPGVLALRAASLRKAWRPPVEDRLAYLEDRSRGRRVLDIGCVAHDVARMSSPYWLHGRLAAVGDVTGVDILGPEVEEMRARGFDVILHDLSEGFGPVLDRGPYDVIVAGELIEHVENIGMLFSLAREALSTDGELIITTPNPFAPHRVRAAHRGIVWENVDHILFAFPSGVAELAERHELVLAEAATTTTPRRSPIVTLKAARTWLRGRGWRTVGFSSSGDLKVRRVDLPPRFRAIDRLLSRSRPFRGETFVYVVRRAPADG